MTPIESKLKELENMEYELTELVPDESATVNGGSANGVTLMYANEVNAVLEQYGRQEAKLIAALREAVSTLQSIQRMGNVPGAYAATAINGIEKILNGGK